MWARLKIAQQAICFENNSMRSYQKFRKQNSSTQIDIYMKWYQPVLQQFWVKNNAIMMAISI